MNGKTRAIETEYAGYRFRSRIEARWACFFDALNIRWEYEKEGFEFAGGIRYLPDFWLADLYCWFEVKGARPSIEEVDKARRLRTATDWPVVIAAGAISNGPYPCFANDIGHSSGGASEWEVRWYICDGCGRAKLSWGDGCHTIVGPDWTAHPAQWCVKENFRPALPDDCGPRWSEHDAALDAPIYQAIKAARSARFEYGERGGRR